MKFNRILRFSPRLTFEVLPPGNFYAPPHGVTGLSRRVKNEHILIKTGAQHELFCLAEQAYLQLTDFGAESDMDVHEIISVAIEYAAKAKKYAIDSIRREGFVSGHRGLVLERIEKMWPDEWIRISIKDEQFGIPKDRLVLCLLGIILHLIDATLCALQNRPFNAVDPAMRAAYCISAVLALEGWSILGNRHPSTAGGQSKKERSERVAKYACSLVEGKTYRSRAEAVRQIKQRVIDFAASEENWTMSVNQADTTISGWLAAQGLPLLAG
ncbi:hypothetical protein [Burkholderia gladioli]|uniref:hypothetical protein n=1 Tax=Burkholderia gladioli TaxID=28095 RepID=UPI0016412F36|nr:hypothetical protein [Burkholderia gladioli]